MGQQQGHLAYLIGAPGSGKTTALRRALPPPICAGHEPVPHMVHDGFVQLGKHPDHIAAHLREFGGTDTLAMNVQPKVLAWLTEKPRRVVGEGDRLGNLAFFRALAEAGYRVDVFSLVLPPAIALTRAVRRAEEMGRTPQSWAWARGRETKVRHIRRAWPVHRVGAHADADTVAARLRARLREHAPWAVG